MSGTYVLVIDVPRTTRFAVGALGEYTFDAGTYAYVGSAFGPGGFSRVERHRELVAGDRDTRHWHIDYLLGRPETTLETAIIFPDADRECELAAQLPGTPVDGFGASDCECAGHLLAVPDADTVREAAVEAGGVVDGTR
ncbi:Uri superfamily endonuclease [Natrinema hispanicum]|uniref:Uri superfamily endonuclease n=1 Tax=Natrinema hispanicum TaxID=392421 RepID=A0A482Y8B1_9EURY|nr:GIY-YIG nuclease family protein [Natrinema hispanicum]RZV11443.1 Uri superfamily endonuclease [Natrinema hispanicum]